MNIFTSCYTDKGNIKKINQDSVSLKVVNSPAGRIVFGIVCDGMGGLEQGELASKEMVVALNNWFVTQFAQMISDQSFSEEKLFEQWQSVIDAINERIGLYASKQGMMMGTTLSAALLFGNQFFLCHVGDSRIYKIDERVEQLTLDHTLVAQEVREGLITEEQALIDPRRSVLLQCVGASESVYPQYVSGTVTTPSTFVLASDGFVHKVLEEEMRLYLHADNVNDKEDASVKCEELVKLAMERGERDNITVAAIFIKE